MSNTWNLAHSKCSMKHGCWSHEWYVPVTVLAAGDMKIIVVFKFAVRSVQDD